MLEQLDSVKWDSLRHVQGPASDVPEALRALAGSDADAQDEALEFLVDTIFHQGDVFDSTLAAWPFLVELATGPTLDDERRGLLLLNMGTTAYWASLADEPDAPPDSAELVDEETQVKLAHPSATRAVVTPTFPKLLGMLPGAKGVAAAALVNLCTQNPACGAAAKDTLQSLRAGAKEGTPLALLIDVALASFSKDEDALEASLHALMEKIPEATERADEEAPLRAVAAMASEDAVISLLD